MLSELGTSRKDAHHLTTSKNDTTNKTRSSAKFWMLAVFCSFTKIFSDIATFSYFWAK